MDVKEMLRELGEDIVDEAFRDLFSEGIPSPMATRVLRRFQGRWKDYTRAALMVMSCQAVGGDPAVVRPAAKALVLAGGAFDLHDDIIDRSFQRRRARKRSIQGIYGMEATLLAGDALLIGGLACLTSMPGAPEGLARRAVSEIRKGLFELGSAEMEELALVRSLDSTPRRYLRIVHMKSADVESYTRVGAILGGGSEREITALGSFGRHLGAVCILRDDLEDTFNDLWELRSRVTQESLPLPIVYALGDRRCRALLQTMFGRRPEDITDQELEQLMALVDENRGFQKGQELISRHVASARRDARGLKDPAPFLALFH